MAKRRFSHKRRVRLLIRVHHFVYRLALLLYFAYRFMYPHFDLTSTSHRKKFWYSARTLQFTTLWPHHKVRNAVIYTCLRTRRIPVLRRVIYACLTCPDSFYHDSFDSLFEVPRLCFSHACLKRLGRSHYVYAEFVLRTHEKVLSTIVAPPKPSTEGKIAVLVEPRRHPLLEFSIKQVMSVLGPEWALQLFLSTKNEEFIRDRLSIHPGGSGEHIVVTQLKEFGLDNMSQYGNRVQSAFSLHERMYESILSEHILWFQVDVVLRARPSNNWLQFAYIGAEWYGCEYPSCTDHLCTKICGGGNSGLSLRRRSKLLKIATRGNLPGDLWGTPILRDSSWRPHFADDHAYFAADEIRDNRETRWFEDDLQISSKLSILGELPPSHVPSQFAMADAIPLSGTNATHPIGLHKPWTAPRIQPQVIMDLLQSPFDLVMM